VNPETVRCLASEIDAGARELRAVDAAIQRTMADLDRVSAAGGATRIGVSPGQTLSDARFASTNASTPQKVSAWWGSLTADERASLIREESSRIGNLDGIPPDDRFAANRINIQRHIDELEASGASRSEIDHYRGFLADDRQIMLFDPTGDGRIAEVFGDLRTADDIAVVVPGIGNDLRSYDPRDAYELHRAAGQDTATIMWLGYDTPTGLTSDLVTDPSLISAARAREWAGHLGRFTDGLRTTGYGEISVVAHSYGTVLATEAAKGGMSVDRVVLMGSPGIPASDVSVFRGADVFAVRNVGDFVSAGSAHGTDPTDPTFGATVLGSNELNPLNGSPHSTYLRPGSNALGEIVKAIQSPRVSPDGLFRHRYVNTDGSAEDVSLPGF
jgi:pimeloyl-ACP methyl ester carboxylesterase